MLTEEAFILLATLAASGFLVLGVLEILWPSSPRRPVRRARLAPATLFEPLATLAARDIAETEPAPRDTVPASSTSGRVGAAASRRIAAPPRAPRAIDWQRAATQPPVLDERAATEPGTPPASESPATDVPPPAPSLSSVETVTPARRSETPDAGTATPDTREARPQVLPIDTCLTMYKDGRYSEVVSLGSAALAVHARLAQVSGRPDEASALHDLVGLAKQELGDRDGALAAFFSAVRGAEPLVRPTYVRHLVTLVRSALDPAGAATEGVATAARLRDLRVGIVAVDDALGIAPGDEALEAAGSALREALAAACEQLVSRLHTDDAGDEARALIVETLGDERMPGAWRERVREQLASASSAEIGQLTAQAIRSVQEGKDVEALEALDRAERLATALPSGAVADERREEFERRLWWGYTKVGLRRVEEMKFDDALAPLVHALGLGGVDEERLGETRSALVRALNGLVDEKSPAIEKLAAEDPAAAQIEIEKLWALLRGSAEHGIGQDDIAEAHAKLMHLGQSRPRATS
jgi:hypothetical protein